MGPSKFYPSQVRVGPGVAMPLRSIGTAEIRVLTQMKYYAKLIMKDLEVNTNEILCKIDNEGFRSDCLDIWFYKIPILTITVIVKNSQIMKKYNSTLFKKLCNNTLQVIELVYDISASD